MKTARCAVFVFLLVMLSPVLGTAQPIGVVSGDIFTGRVVGRTGGLLNTVDLTAFSRQGVPARIGPNAVTSDTTLGDSTTIIDIILGRTPPLIRTINPAPRAGLPIQVGNKRYAPTVALRNANKPAAPDISRTVASQSGALRGFAQYIVGGRLIAGGINLALGTAGGDAAGEAIDPIEVDPGTFADYRFPIDADIELAQETDFGGLVFFALDSRYTDVSTFVERGEPLDQVLWSLSILADGIPSSFSDLNFQFDINDQALTDGAIILPLNSGTGLPFTEKDIEDLVKMEFTVLGGKASASFILFPENTTYKVDRVIQYAAGLKGGLSTPVPEPSTLVLFGSGLAGLIGLGRKRLFKKA